MKLLNVSCSFN